MVDGDQRVGGRCAQSLGRGRVALGAAGQVEGQLRTSNVGADQRQADELCTKWEGGFAGIEDQTRRADIGQSETLKWGGKDQ